MPNFVVIFDEIVKDKLQHAVQDGVIKGIVKRWIDELEEKGPESGKLLDNHIWLYEMKNKHPPLRLYYHYQKSLQRIIIFEFEMKTSEKKQQKTISRLRHWISIFRGLFVYNVSSLYFRGTQATAYRENYYEVF